jgi:Zn-dependent protease with chaperone function
MSLAGQAILQTLVAALIIEALVRAWQIRTPGLLLGLRGLLLLVPFLVVPGFRYLAPWRLTDSFTEQWALFYGGHWSDLRVDGIGLDHLALAVSVALGLVLYLADLVPFLVERISARGERLAAPGSSSIAEDVRQAAAAMGISPPPTALSDARMPLLFCTGLRPALVVSQAARDGLDAAEWRAALSHEIAHVRFRDPAWGWALMLARTAMCFNPVVQIVARVMIRDMERRADVAAVRATRDPAAMGRAIRKLAASSAHDGTKGPTGMPARLPSFLTSLRARAVTRRCDMLAADPYPADARFQNLRLALALIGLPLLLFFVV